MESQDPGIGSLSSWVMAESTTFVYRNASKEHSCSHWFRALKVSGGNKKKRKAELQGNDHYCWKRERESCLLKEQQMLARRIKGSLTVRFWLRGFGPRTWGGEVVRVPTGKREPSPLLSLLMFHPTPKHTGGRQEFHHVINVRITKQVSMWGGGSS